MYSQIDYVMFVRRNIVLCRLCRCHVVLFACASKNKWHQKEHVKCESRARAFANRVIHAVTAALNLARTHLPALVSHQNDTELAIYPGY